MFYYRIDIETDFTINIVLHCAANGLTGFTTSEKLLTKETLCGEMEGQANEEYQSQLKTCENELVSLWIKPLKRGQGPICSELDHILEKHHAVPQANHSSSFIGNHCYKYMTKAVYTNLTKHIISTAAQLATDQSVSAKTIFDALNGAVSLVHTLVSHTRKIDQSTQDTIRKAITSNISLYRRHSHNISIM